MKSFGGLPGGVVDFTPTERKRRIRSHVLRSAMVLIIPSLLAWRVLPFAGVSSFSLKVVSMSLGNVFPRSQMSTSFLILAYYTKAYVS